MPDPCGSYSMSTPQTWANGGGLDTTLNIGTGTAFPGSTIGLIATFHSSILSLGGWDIMVHLYITNTQGTGTQTHLTEELSVLMSRSGDTSAVLTVPAGGSYLHYWWGSDPAQPSAANTVTWDISYYCTDTLAQFNARDAIFWDIFVPPAAVRRRGFAGVIG